MSWGQREAGGQTRALSRRPSRQRSFVGRLDLSEHANRTRLAGAPEGVDKDAELAFPTVLTGVGRAVPEHGLTVVPDQPLRAFAVRNVSVETADAIVETSQRTRLHLDLA